MYKLFLFDVDETLVSTGAAGDRALNRAIKGLYGTDNAMGDISPHGKTDPLIVKEILNSTLNIADVSKSQVDEVLEEYARILPEEIMRSQEYQVLKGVSNCLTHLKADKKNIIALATGNLERGARIKLERGDLNKHFAFGGFASDSEIRHEILKIAKQKAEDIVGKKISNSSVFVIGDTPLDIKACHENGFRMIAVASGHYSMATLSQSKPEFVIEHLGELENALSQE